MLFKPYILLLAFAIIASTLIFPPPLTQHLQDKYLHIGNICNLYQSPSTVPKIHSQYYLSKILQRINKNQVCQRHLTFIQGVHTLIKLKIQSNLKPEAYMIQIDEQGIQLTFSDYSGYVYALESLSQIVKDNKIPYGIVKDQPLLSYRGIMIDSARHYLKVQTIKKLLESMPLSKLNILHWHIVDDESFPLKLGSHPQLSDYGKYQNNLIYTIDDVKQLIRIGDLNAVKIIPQIDTPAHVRSWGLAPEWINKNISIKCNGGTGYNGQFDVSKPQVFKLAQDVIKEVDGLFSNSPYFHLGGDQVSSNCWNLRPQIQNFMKLKNIKNYGQLQMYWRYQMKQVLPQNRKVIFWRNDAANVTIGENDILHYWGAQADVSKVTSGSKSKIILSPSDILYLNKGQGNLWLNGTQGQYSVWRNIYQNFIVFPEGVDRSRIYGAEVCLWGEVSNDDTLQNNLWMRSTAFASRVWTEKMMQIHEIAASMVKIQRALNDKGVDASPFTSQFCEYKPQICWPPKSKPTNPKTVQPLILQETKML